MKQKKIYYSDTVNDDFSGTHIRARTVDENFKYLHKSLIWKGISAFLYYCIALPLVLVIDRVWFGLRFENRKALQDAIEDAGGKSTGSVSVKTDYLINNDIASTSSKNKKAKELGIPIITEEEVMRMLGL